MEEKYEIIVLQAIKKCSNIANVCKNLGLYPSNTNYEKIKKIIEKYSIDTSHFIEKSNYKINRKKYNFEEIFVDKSPIRATSKIRKYLFKYGIKEKRCECCGNIEWNNKEIPLQVHHINGKPTDNRLQNLQILCPNCHSQTDTFCGKNKKTKIKPLICKICGIEFIPKSKNQKFCSKSCANKSRKVLDDKKELIELLSEFNGNFSKASKKIGITDNALRKRCVKNGLPKHSSEIVEFLKKLNNK